ncbi:MAG: hypothetical protein LCH85_02145 [Chloroflexi bacterium]|nr:hypothetical protein [Chloroflexota bacterium]
MIHLITQWRAWLLIVVVVWLGVPANNSSAQPQNINQQWDRSQKPTTTLSPTQFVNTQGLTGTWQTEVADLQPDYGRIDSATIGPDGDLYLGGYFNQVAGVNVYGLVRWDGTSWSGVAADQFDWRLSAPGYQSMTFFQNNLFVGGSKPILGNLPKHSLIRWDGATWQSTGSGASQWGWVEHITQYDNELYILGDFSSFNGVPADGLVRWDGSVTTPMTITLDDKLTMNTTSSGIYISGLVHEEYETLSMLYHWDGTSFHTLPLDVEVASIKAFNDQIYGIKHYTNQTSALMRWNGTTWIPIVDAVPGMLAAYALDADQTYLSTLNGLEIQVYSYAANSLNPLPACECTDKHSLYLAHNQLFINSSAPAFTPTDEPALSVYANNQWQEVPVYHSPSLRLQAGAQVAYLLHDQLLSWEEQRWKTVALPTSHPIVQDWQAADDQSLYIIARHHPTMSYQVYRYVHGASAVSILPAFQADHLYTLSIIDGQTPVVVANTGLHRWNGSGWDNLGFPPNTANLNIQLFSYRQSLYAMVETSSGGDTTNIIHRWNGSAWVEPTTPLTGTVSEFAVNADGLYVIGQFEHAGEDYELINWDGDQFNGIASSNVRIEAIEATATGVYVGGWFSQLGDCVCYNLGYWNGKAWSAVGDGTNGRVLDLALADDRLFVYGLFNQVGRNTALGLAIWQPTTTHTIYLPFARK